MHLDISVVVVPAEALEFGSNQNPMHFREQLGKFRLLLIACRKLCEVFNATIDKDCLNLAKQIINRLQIFWKLIDEDSEWFVSGI